MGLGTRLVETQKFELPKIKTKPKIVEADLELRVGLRYTAQMHRNMAISTQCA